MPKSNRRSAHNPWTPAENEKLADLAIKYGAKRWKVIAAEMGTRDAKQCRERYHGHIDKIVNKCPLTEDEDRLIIYYRGLNFGWARIAKKLSTDDSIRTPNQIKNNYNQRLKLLIKKISKPIPYNSSVCRKPVTQNEKLSLWFIINPTNST